MTYIALGVPYKQEQSIHNAKIVLQAVQQRFPNWADKCVPYENVLPVRAWNDRGYRVKKGQKAIKVWTRIPQTKKNAAGQEEIVGERHAVANVFALPQVEPL
jgi:hypothetical protein